MLLCAVEGFKERNDVVLVGVGCGGEAGFVDTVVNEVVGPGVGLVDLTAERLGVELDGALLVIEEVVELAKDHVSQNISTHTSRNIEKSQIGE